MCNININKNCDFPKTQKQKLWLSWGKIVIFVFFRESINTFIYLFIYSSYFYIMINKTYYTLNAKLSIRIKMPNMHRIIIDNRQKGRYLNMIHNLYPHWQFSLFDLCLHHKLDNEPREVRTIKAFKIFCRYWYQYYYN